MVKTAESVVQDPEWSALIYQSLGVARGLGKCSVLFARSSVALFTSVVSVLECLSFRSNAQALSRSRVAPSWFASLSRPRYYAVAQLV